MMDFEQMSLRDASKGLYGMYPELRRLRVRLASEDVRRKVAMMDARDAAFGWERVSPAGMKGIIEQFLIFEVDGNLYMRENWNPEPNATVWEIVNPEVIRRWIARCERRFGPMGRGIWGDFRISRRERRIVRRIAKHLNEVGENIGWGRWKYKSFEIAISFHRDFKFIRSNPEVVVSCKNAKCRWPIREASKLMPVENLIRAAILNMVC